MKTKKTMDLGLFLKEGETLILHGNAAHSLDSYAERLQKEGWKLKGRMKSRPLRNPTKAFRNFGEKYPGRGSIQINSEEYTDWYRMCYEPEQTEFIAQAMAAHFS